MRDRRLALIGAILKLIDEYRQLELGLFEIRHGAWYFTPRYNQPEPRWWLVSAIRQDFSALLKYGPFEAPGFLIGFLSGRYNPEAGNIQLFVRGVCAGEKLGALLKDNVDIPVSFDLDVHDAKDLPRQLAAMMPNRILELRADGNIRKFRRMREPWHSVYLIWAAQEALSCRVFTNDIAVDDHGDLFICRNLHQDRRKSTPTFAESSFSPGGTPEEVAAVWSSMVPAR